AESLAALADLHLRTGKPNAARTCIDAIKPLQPLLAHAVAMKMRSFPKAHADLMRLEAWARQPDECAQIRSDLMFGLAAAWEAQEDYSRAFSIAVRANAAIRANLSFDPELQRQRHQRMVTVFNSPKTLPPANTGLTPIFVVGMPGAGVSWMTRMLAAHPSVARDSTTSSLSAAIDQFRNGDAPDTAAENGARARARRYPEGLNSLHKQPALDLRADLLARWRAAAGDKRYLVDGTPLHYENIGLIQMLFPKAKIIVMQRDPRAITLANFLSDYPNRHGPMAFAYDLRWIGAHIAHHLQLMEHW
ncbi:MAG: sulfotransferase family protein, partial [Litorivicinus sp.]